MNSNARTRILVAHRTQPAAWTAQLVENGFVVESTRDRAQYERRIRDWGPDVLITDLDPEPGRRTSVIEAARVVDPDLIILPVVGPHQMADAAAAMELGASGFLVEPVLPQALLQVVRHELEHQHVLNEVRRLKNSQGLGELTIPGATLGEIEKIAILRSLEAANGSTGKAAKMLGISVRKIQYRLREWKETSPDLFKRQGNRIILNPKVATTA